MTARSVGTMTGAALGGGLVALGGLTASAALNAITYLGVLGYLAVVLRLRFPMPRMDPTPMLRAIGEGFGHLRTTPTTRTLVITLSGLNLAVGPALGLGLALRVREAEWGAGTLGVFQALVACGALVGGAVMIRWRPHRPAPLAFTLLVVQGLAIVLLATPTVLVTAMSCAVIGLTAGAASALLYAVFVRSVAPEFLGRLGSIQRLGDDCLMPTAMAGSPMASMSEAPKSIGVRSRRSTRSTARSVRGSDPIKVAGYRAPSANTTARLPDPATTW